MLDGATCWPSTGRCRRVRWRIGGEDGRRRTTRTRRHATMADRLRRRSLAPAVTRAARSSTSWPRTAAKPVGPSELARRLGLPEVVDRQHLRRARRRRSRPAGRDGLRPRAAAGRARRCVPRDGRPGPGVLRSESAARGGLRGDGPVRRPRRPRDDVPRPPRRSTAGASHLGIGRRLPASCTATGKAALASLDDAELARRFAGVTACRPSLGRRTGTSRS